jgi:hypothetical protein
MKVGVLTLFADEIAAGGEKAAISIVSMRGQ